MAIKPILFSTEMVRALLAGRKTVTRRVIKPQPKSRLAFIWTGNKCERWTYPGVDACKYWGWDKSFYPPDGLTDEDKNKCWTPPYHSGDILYVRETWQFVPCTDCRADAACAEHPQTYETQACVYDGCYLYLADYPQVDAKKVHWHPSIHMPREAARIFLRVKNVRVKRLQDITITDLQNEGIVPQGYLSQYSVMTSNFFEEFIKALWDSTIKPKDRSRYGWAANPWVWVIEFERISKEEASGDV